MVSRAKDWLEQAQRDLEHARRDCESEYYEWSCFSAQQAAEKALKALFQHLGAEARGHSVKALLENLPRSEAVPRELIDQARILDRFYIPTRYPNTFDHGKPADYYTQNDAEQAITCAQDIIRFCKDRVSRQGGGG